VLKTIGDAVPAGIELGYHLCYGSPADEHCVQPKDAGIMVEMTNAIAGGVGRSSSSICPCPGAHRRRLLRAARDIEAGSGDRTLPRSHPPRRRRGRRHSASRRAALRAHRRHRHRPDAGGGIVTPGFRPEMTFAPHNRRPSSPSRPSAIFPGFYRFSARTPAFPQPVRAYFEKSGRPKELLTKASCCQGNERGRLSPYLRVGEYRLRPKISK
jgi:hypothetical protein